MVSGLNDNLFWQKKNARPVRQTANEDIKDEASVIKKREMTDEDLNAMYSIYLKFTELGHGDNSPVLISELENYIETNNLNTSVSEIKNILISRYKTEQKQKENPIDNTKLEEYLDFMESQTTAIEQSQAEGIEGEIEQLKNRESELTAQISEYKGTKESLSNELSSMEILEQPDRNDYIYGFNEVNETEYNLALKAYKRQQGRIREINKKIAELESKIEETDTELGNTKAKIEELEQKKDEELKEQINEYINETYPELANDREFIQSIASIDIEGAEVKAKIDMAASLIKTAEEKGVDKTDYVSSRYIPFLQMQAENPELTLEEMNEKLAVENVNALLFDSVNAVIGDMFGTEIENAEQLFDAQGYELLLADEHPELREAYIQTNNMLYLNMAQEGNLTRNDYYELIKDDLANIFPNSDEMEETEKQELQKLINKLSPEEVQDFINKAISVPGCYDENYETACSDLMAELQKATAGKDNYKILNPDEAISLSEVYSEISGVEFNPDSIINTNTTLQNIELAFNECVIYQAAQNLFDAVDENYIDIGSALWQVANIYTQSADENVLIEFLKDVTNCDDIYIENGKVVVPEQMVARTRGSIEGRENTREQNVWETVKNWCTDTFGGIADLLISDSVQEDFKNADLSTIDGVINYIDALTSNPDTYKDLGKLVLTGTAIAATGGIAGGVAAGGAAITGSAGAGVAWSTALGAASYLTGAMSAFANSCSQNGGATYENLTNLAADVLEGMGYLAGIKYANNTIQLPAFIKGAFNKITSSLTKSCNSTLNNIKSVLGAKMNNVSNWWKTEVRDTKYDFQELYSKYLKVTGQKVDLDTYLSPEEMSQLQFMDYNVGTLGRVVSYINTNNINPAYRATQGAWGCRGQLINVNENVQTLIRDAVDKMYAFGTKKQVDAFRKIRQMHLPDEEKAQYLKVIDKYAAKNKIPVDLLLHKNDAAYDKQILKLLDEKFYEGKSLADWLKGIKTQKDALNFNKMLEENPIVLHLDDSMNTNLLPNLPYTDLNIDIKVDAGTHGAFVDILGNQIEYTQRLLKGDLNINSVMVDDEGRIFIMAKYEQIMEDGTSVIRQAAIYLGAILGASLPAEAHSENTQQPQHTTGGGTNNDRIENSNPFDNLNNNEISDSNNGTTNEADNVNNNTSDLQGANGNNANNSESGDANNDNNNTDKNNDFEGMPFGPGHPDYDSLYGDVVDEHFNAEAEFGDKLPNGNMKESGTVDYSSLFHNTGTDGKSISSEYIQNDLIKNAENILKQKYGDNAKISMYFDAKGVLHWTVTYNPKNILNNNNSSSNGGGKHGGGSGGGALRDGGGNEGAGYIGNTGGTDWGGNTWGGSNWGNNSGGGGGSVAVVEIEMDWYDHPEVLINEMH